MTVRDSAGAQTTVTRDIHPNTTSWTVGTNVPGSLVVVDGTLQAAPYTQQDVVGVTHLLMGLPGQTVGGVEYRLHSWSGGTAGQSNRFTSTASPQTFTTVLDPVNSAVPVGWSSVDIGSPITAGTARYAASDGAFYIDGSGSDIYGTKDQFHYVYQTLTGDGTIVARVLYQTNSDAWAKAGVMFKESAVSGAPWVDALVSPDVSSSTPNINGVSCTVNGCAAPLPPVDPAVGNGVREQYSPSGSVQPASPLPNYFYPNKWLKLQRVGNTFTAYQSLDGATWSKIGSRTVTMASTATVGLFATSHDVGQLSSVGFDNVSVSGSVALPPDDFSISANPTVIPVTAGAAGSTSVGTAVVSGSPQTVDLSASGMPSGVTVGFSPTSVTTGTSSALTLNVGASTAPGSYPITVTGTSSTAAHSTTVTLTVSAAGGLPSPWLDTDVGAPAPAGSASVAGGVFTVNGSGADIFGTNDQFNYLYQPTSGNGTIVARVTSETNAGSTNDKAGVIWKASTVAGSPYILIGASYQGVVKVQYNFNGSVTSSTFTYPNLWLKLVRSGSLFSAYVSADGATWTAVLLNKSLTTIPTAATVGLFECSHKSGSLGTATFDNVSFTPGP